LLHGGRELRVQMVQSPTLHVLKQVWQNIFIVCRAKTSLGPVPAQNTMQLHPCCVSICVWRYAHRGPDDQSEPQEQIEWMDLKSLMLKARKESAGNS